MRSTHVVSTRFSRAGGFSRVAATLLAPLALFACGGPVGPDPAAPPHPAPSASAALPPAPPADQVALDVFVDGAPAGHETWAVTHQADGTTDIAFDAVLEEKGVKLTGKGSLSLAADLTTRTAHITLDTPDGAVNGDLKGSASNGLSLTLSRGTESREVHADQPSNVFLPQPFFVGFARLCPLLETGKAGTAPLVEFPGSAMTVIDKQPLAGADGVTLYMVERGALGKTAVACEKGEVVAALDAWSGQSTARTGKKPVLDALVLATTRQKPKVPDGVVEEDVTVTVPALAKDVEAKLACSFMKPVVPAPAAGKPAKRLPAVAFYSGSGPQDRDEDTVGPGGVKLSVFKTMAIALAQQGVASIRCDDRGVAASTGAFEQATLGTFVRDAEEVLKALKARPDVDPLRVGLIGHSEGAVVVPVVAHAEPKTRAVLLMAAPGRPIPDIAVVQQERLLAAAGLPKDQIEKQLAAQAEVLTAIRKGDPLPATVPVAERARIESQRAWLKSHFDHDPQLALRQVPAMAVMVVQGGKDLQVPVDDAELVKKGLAAGKNPKAKVVVYPTLNHIFSESHGGSLAEYSDPRAKVDPTFLTDMASFFAQALGAK